MKFSSPLLALTIGVTVLFTVFGCGPAPSSAARDELPTLRVVAIPSGFQGLIAELINHYELDRANGFQLRTIDSAGSRGANFIALKTGQADLLTSNWVDAAINRQGGLGVSVIIPFMKWSNGWVVPANSDIRSLADFRGKRIGVTNPNQLDWIITRVIAQRAHGFDPGEDATVTIAAPGLLSGLIEQDKLDVVLQYTEPALQMARSGDYRQLFSVNELMGLHGLAPAAPFTCFLLADTFREAHPEVPIAYFRAYQEALQRLHTDPAALDIVARAFDLTDPAQAVELRDMVLANVYQEIDPQVTAAAQELFGVFRDTLGSESLGIAELPPGVFQWVE
jgi:NitT/TauT family transport system substrate-binding protein